MVEKVESFVRRLRWKAYPFCKENRKNNSNQCKNFGFKTVVTPPQNEDLTAFENNMYDMIRNVELTLFIYTYIYIYIYIKRERDRHRYNITARTQNDLVNKQTLNHLAKLAK